MFLGVSLEGALEVGSRDPHFWLDRELYRTEKQSLCCCWSGVYLERRLKLKVFDRHTALI
jgi:hypothetical protein